MRTRAILLGTWLAVHAAVVWGAPETKTIADFEGAQTALAQGTKVVDDAAGGQHALAWDVPPGGAQSIAFRLDQAGVKTSEWDTLSFDYKVLAPGVDWWGVKIADYPLAEGWQATWQVKPGEALVVGKWEHAAIDLHNEMYRWGQEPDKTSHVLWFRAQLSVKQPVIVLLDNVRVERSRVRVAPAAPGKAELVGNTATTSYQLRLENRTDQALEASLAATTVPTGVRLRLKPTKLTVPAGGAATAQAVVTADLTALDSPPRLSRQTCVVTMTPGGEAADAQRVEVSLTVPLGQPKHPCLLITPEEVPTVLAKADRLPQWKTRLAQLKGNCDAWLAKTPVYPDRGSQWWHWYTCKKCGATLKTKSPTEHVCPDCGAVYTGWPYDDVVLARDHDNLARAIRDLGLMYVLTKDEAYARKAREILLGYSERYLKYPLHDINGKPNKGGGHVGPQTLDESTWLIPVAQGFDCIYNFLSADDRRTIVEQMLLPAANLIHDHQWGIHNICCWHDSAYGLVGITLGDERLAYDAIEGPKGFRAQVAKGITDDGFWYENAWGYHFYTMNALMPLAEAARRIGIDLYSPRYKSLYDAPLEFMSGAGELPSFADSGRLNVLSAGNAPLYEIAFARWHDPKYAAILKLDSRRSMQALLVGADVLPTEADMSLGSKVFASAGFAILRSRSEGSKPSGIPDNYVAIHYGPHGGGHGHPDKLSFVMYGHNQLLATDPGSIAYGNPAHAEWYRQTLSHNTIVVDNKSQRECTGTLVCSALGDNAGFVTCSADKAYPGVRLLRTVALIGDELLDLMIADSDEEHVYELAYHSLGAFSTDLQLAPAVNLPPEKPYARVTDWRVASVAAAPAGHTPWSAVWSTDRVRARLVQEASGPAQVFSGVGSDNPTHVKAPLVLSRQSGKSAAWATAVSLFTGAQSPMTRVQLLPLEGGRAFALSATTGGTRDLLITNPAGADVTCEGFQLRGQGALIRLQEGKVTLALLASQGTLTLRGQAITPNQ